MKLKIITKGIIYTLIPMIILFPLKFYYIKVFLKSFGVEINGLIQLFNQIINYMLLIEGGLSAVLTYILYEPINKDDKLKIKCIINKASQMYNKIAILIVLFSIFISPFLKFFISKENKNLFSLEFMITIFFIYVLTNITDYFFYHIRFLLLADQKSHIINLLLAIVNISDYLIGIIMISKNFSIITILIKSFILKIIFNISIKIIGKKIYPWLKKIDVKNEKLNIKLFDNIKYTMINTIAGVIVYNTDYILISKFLNLKDVTIYSNYLILLGVITSFLVPIFSIIRLSIGHLLIEKQIEKIRKVFWEYFSISYFLASFCFVTIYFTIDKFIFLWIGKEFLLDKRCLFFMLINFCHGILRYPSGDFLGASGNFKIGSIPALGEIFINLFCSLFFIRYLGVLGVILGTTISHLICTSWFSQKYCLNEILKEKFYIYLNEWSKNLIRGIILFNIVKLFKIESFLSKDEKLLSYLFSALMFSIVVFCINLFIYLTNKNFVIFLKRFQKVLKN